MGSEIANPTCPECETNLFVAGSSDNDIEHVCEFCDTRFNVVAGEIEVVDQAGEGALPPSPTDVRETPSSDRSPWG